MEYEEKSRELRGSMTVEMSFLMPVILLLIMSCILAVFYFHDKNVLAGAAYETVVVGSTKMREAEQVEGEELKELFYERADGKCILFGEYHVAVNISDEQIEMSVSASRGRWRLSVVKRSALTEPETFIRNIRRVKEIGNGAEDYH